METPIPIVWTKLLPPMARGPSEGRILPRQRLLNRLNLVASCRLTLVCAGAGYGKTTLLSAITALPLPLIWYSLSPTDQDLAVFLSYIVEGIRRQQPDFGGRVLQLLSSKEGTGVSVERVVGELVNSLSELEGIVLVLDDFHAVDRSAAIRKAVDYLLTHLPSNSHLVIATRRSPQLPSLPRLRMGGDVNEIGEPELRFTAEEVEELYVRVYGLSANPEALSAVFDQTEGWIIALQLAAHSLGGARPDQAGDLLKGLARNQRGLFEYLAKEVFERQPAALQRFLRESSILSTLSVEACNAVLRRADSEAMIDQIALGNLFCVEISGGSWRYHHLFRDFLRQQIRRDAGSCDDLHRRAGDFFENGGNYVQAIQHYLAGADYGKALALMTRVGPAMLTASRFDTLSFWTGQIPERELVDAPDVLLLQARVFEVQGRYQRALDWLDRASRAFSDRGDEAGIRQVLRSRASMAAWRLGRFAEAKALYGEALDRVGHDSKTERADLLALIALTHLLEANPSEARETYQEALDLYRETRDEEGLLAAMISPGTWIYRVGGDFADGFAELRRALAIAERLGSKHRQAECYGGMAVLLRHLDRCDEAKECALKALELSREIGAVRLETDSLLYLALVYQGGPMPDLKAARTYARQSARLGESEGYERVATRSLIDEVAILCRTGPPAEARRLGELLLASAERMGELWFKANAQMNVGVALTDHDDARAGELLRSALEAFSRYEDKWSLTCVHFWLARLHARVDPSLALEHLRVSLDLAKSNGYDFWFREEHRAAAPLLRAAMDRGIFPEYCARLIESFGPDGSGDQEAWDATREDFGHASAGNRLHLDPRLPAPGLDAIMRSQVDQKRGAVGARGKPSSPAGAPSLRIHCFGNFRVYVGGREIQEGEWQRKKVKSLVEYLAASEGHTITRDQLAEVFWGDLRPEAARVSLRKALHLARRVLEPDPLDATSRYILSERDRVLLSPSALEMVDVDRFLRHVSAAQKAERAGDAPRAEQEYHAAQDLYVGDFLVDDPYEDWIVPARERFKNLAMTALHKLAGWRIAVRDYEAAVSYLRKMIDVDSTREDAHALLMQCLARLGRRPEAQAQYAACLRALRTELDLEPSPETRALYSRLLAGETL